MARHTLRLREQARQLYLTGDIGTVAEIARRLKVKAHTVGRWRKSEDWDALRLKIDRRAAEQMVEKLATERVTLNMQHFKFWGVVVGKLFESLQTRGLQLEEVRTLEKVAGILEKTQRGQRLARGLSLDGETEEQIRADAEAESRALVDLFIEVIKSEIKDDQLRDRIARAIFDRVPTGFDEEH